jgi:aminopeptidase YwaD
MEIPRANVLTILPIVVALLILHHPLAAQKPPLLPENQVAALAQELSGEAAKRNLEGIARNHRQRGSRGFHAAAELVAERARAYGLSGVEILTFPADGKIFYGTQRSRPPWDADFAELWELRRNGDTWMPSLRMASYDAMPITLAEDSESADVTADLVDVGSGTAESDYARREVRGKIILASGQPGAVQALAVNKFGAAGIISYAMNQRTAWWGEDENLIRWGHLQSFPQTKTFAFMVSLKTARSLRERLAQGEEIRLHSVVRAGQHAGNYEVVTATIPGADPQVKDQEIAFSCHLDHQRPGANDNASGCVTILEVARTLRKLIDEGKLARPARTLRFIWPPEIEGTTTLLNAHPDFVRRIKAVIHMDMVGGGPETKAIFHVTRGPMSLPSFVHDVAEAFAMFVNEQTERFANTGIAEYPLIAPEGGKEPLRADFARYSMGSDHDVYQDSSFHIPAIYLNDWPDRYIHTNFDVAANIDPTKLKRAAFIGAASGYFLANFTGIDDEKNARLAAMCESSYTRRLLADFFRARDLSDQDLSDMVRAEFSYKLISSMSVEAFNDGGTVGSVSPPELEFRMLAGPRRKFLPETTASGDGLLVFARNPEPKGALAVFGYDYFEAHASAAGIAMPKLGNYQGLWGGGEEYAYETLNFADGRHNAQQIRDAVSAEYGPVPLELVVEYLKALETIGVVKRK